MHVVTAATIPALQYEGSALLELFTHPTSLFLPWLDVQ
jgi:hypothetical protein